ncbi:MAG: tryptophan synthase subunit alpha [Planctomycetes bacterium]|nr:tryptophan synthase subunit alpha [Planctomycetota bacterium]MBU1517698.1 tryptophan synthase subunit alpha [Planctomycetota bacterium]MBU2457237.1 tryptophan synthase subunit alpha [Planctomycetota bacterium]MBU2596184.1 tryptophan synthase subunit alpha [Planctomycetota bacterium]
MKSYKQTFAGLKHAALIPFFVIGDPDFDTSLEIIKAAIDAGADVLELGIAFSDPIADGPTIQKADIRALSSGIDIEKAKDFIKKVKAYKDIPIGLLMYYNLIFQYGTEKFFTDFANAGTNSVLIADLSIDDVDEIYTPARKAGLDTVFMVTPNTETERAKKIAEKCTGFIYTVSLLGVTGGRDTLSDMIKPLISRLKSITDVPVCVGFGVSTPAHAVELAKAGADGVIIGSRIVRIIEENLNDKKSIPAKVKSFLTQIKEAIVKV